MVNRRSRVLALDSRVVSNDALSHGLVDGRSRQMAWSSSMERSRGDSSAVSGVVLSISSTIDLTIGRQALRHKALTSSRIPIDGDDFPFQAVVNR